MGTVKALTASERKAAHRNKMIYKREERAKVQPDQNPAVYANLSRDHPLCVINRTGNRWRAGYGKTTIAEHNAYRAQVSA